MLTKAEPLIHDGLNSPQEPEYVNAAKEVQSSFVGHFSFRVGAVG
jgi:hypothetical protein